MKIYRISQHLLLSMTLLLGACGLLDDSASKKPSRTGLIATPVTYYSTSRARYLGTKYKDNIDRLVERIVRNSKTSSLQFANNISSVGGIGFFTHSATKTADERYLEVVLAVPETFETKGAHSDKVSRLFSSYGPELLTILSEENDIYQDKEVTGYGLNLAWRNIIAEPVANRVTLERVIVYFAKEKTRNFLRREINQNDLLADATIFAVEEDGPLSLVSYRAPEVHQEFRPAIREDDILAAPAAAHPPPAIKTDSPDQGKKDAPPLREPVAKVAPSKPPVTVAQKPKSLPPIVPIIPETPAKPAVPTAVISVPVELPLVEAAPGEVAKLAVPTPQIAPAAESKETTPVIKPNVKSVEPARAVLDAPKPAVAPKLAAPPPVEVAAPAVVALVPKAVPAPQIAPAAESKEAASVIKPNVKSVEPARAVLDALKPAVAPKLAPPPPVEVAAPAVVALVPKAAPAPQIAPAAESKETTPVIKPNVKSVEPARAVLDAPKPAVAPKLAPPPPVEVAAPREVQAPPANQVKPIKSLTPERVVDTPKSPPVAMYVPPPEPPKVERAVTPTAPAESMPAEVVRAPPVAVRPVPPEPPLEIILPVPAQTTNAPPVVDETTRPGALAPTPVVEEAPAKQIGEQLALLGNKRTATALAKPPIARTAPKPLEGFIIQLAFNDKERAQRWAEGMEKKGFAVSLTEAGAEGALRVRLGNFVLRDDAERQLRTIKQEGLNGIILNLPQAFRPEARTSIP
ncbi:MAG: SPOR domain-containing protein [Candidatus Binatia bacterium]